MNLDYRKKLIEKKVYKYRRHRPYRLQARYGKRQTGSLYALKVYYPFTICHMINKIGVEKYTDKHIVVPAVFSFNQNFDKTLHTFKQILYAFKRSKGDVVLDFSKCEHVCLSVLTLLDILYRDFKSIQRRNKKINDAYIERRLLIIPSSKNLKVKKYLHALRWYRYDDFSEEDGEVLPFDIIKGKYRNSYQENEKARAIRHIVQFINTSFQPVHRSLSDEGLNYFESLMSEILNNAEDHSISGSEWIVHGIAFHGVMHQERVVELNLVIVNFGSSMFEGFEETKELNEENYSKVVKKYNEHVQLFDSTHFFDKESLFVLYMLNEGISRLKYKDPSRGNGTMQFLDAFRMLGNFGEENDKFSSLLSIISGHTVLSCNSQVGPYKEDNHLKLSLNKQKKLSLLPEKEYLNYYQSYFPGTIIECTIYFNEQYWDKIFGNENKN